MKIDDALRAAKDWEENPTWVKRPEVLLSPQIPKPMHQLAPRTILGAKWWNDTRKAAYASTNYHCIACGVHKTQAQYRSWLECHEVYRIDYLAGRMTYLEAVPLCHLCHCYVHTGRMQALLDRGEVHQAKFTAAMIHGDRILRVAGLKRLDPYEGPFAEWGKWRLILNGKEYKPIFKTYEDWCKHFDHA